MQNDNETIYSTIKPYKRNRVFYSKYFRILYEGQVEPKLTLNQYLYKIATHCRLQRLNATDIYTILNWWCAKHGITPNYWYIRNVVIPEVIEHTRETLKAQKKAENERAKAKRLRKNDQLGGGR